MDDEEFWEEKRREHSVEEDSGLLRSNPEAAPVLTEEAVMLAKEINALGYYETSAKTGQGVHEAFAAATKALLTPPTHLEQMRMRCCTVL